MTKWRWDGTALAKWRRRKHLSLTAMEQRCGVSKGSLSKFERNPQTPKSTTAYAICRATGLTDELFREVDDA